MTTKPTNADDGGATTDRAAALAAKLTAKQIAEKIRFLLMDDSILKLSAHERRLALFEAANEVEALEASRPAQDIVAEMREAEIVDGLDVWCALCQKPMKLQTGPNFVHGWYACDKDKHGFNEVVIALSPTKNTAPTEAERD